VDDLVVAQPEVGKASGDEALPCARPRQVAAGRKVSHITIVVRESAGKEAKASGGREASMGQKVNPIGLRLGINRTWDSRWLRRQAEYGKLLHEDFKRSAKSC
jgi:hypothetical protein